MKRHVLDFKGLVTAMGQLQAPNGSMTVAKNVLFPAPGLMEKRPGFYRPDNKANQGIWSMYAPQDSAGRMFCNKGNTSGAVIEWSDGGATAFTALAFPDSSNTGNGVNARMKGAVLRNNVYLTDETGGPARFDLTSGALNRAGIPRALGFDMARVTTVLTGTGSWLTDGASVAYRVVFGFKDGQGVEMIGSPSGRRVVANVTGVSGYAAGVAPNVNLRVVLPFQARTNTTELTSSWFFRLYRTQTFLTGTEPDDEMALCYEYTLTNTDVTNHYVDIVDSTPDAALGAYLYTNSIAGGDIAGPTVAGQSVSLGILASNDLPPVCRDVAVFADSMFYADLEPTEEVVYFFSFLALPANNDVLRIFLSSSFSFTAKTAAPASASEFQIDALGASLSAKIRNTAINFCEAVNARDHGPNLVATYVGNDNSPGTIGKVMLRAKKPGSSFLIDCPTGDVTKYSPRMDALGTNGIGAGNKQVNGLAFSKPMQPDAVPPANYIRVGRSDARILRIVPLRDALFIFKEDGVFWLRGTSPSNFSIEVFDSTFRLESREAVAVVENTIYAWGYEGIAKVTPQGIEFIDLPIRNKVLYNEYLLRNITDNSSPLVVTDDMALNSFAVANPQKRFVSFWYPVGKSTKNCKAALVWNLATQTWSEFWLDNGKSCGCSRPIDGRMWLAEHNGANNSYVWYMNPGFVATDFSDYTPTNTEMAIVSVAVWTNITPEPGVLNHWHELALGFSPSDVVTALALPSDGISMTLLNELGVSEAISLASVTIPSMRAMVPRAVAMSQRLVLSLSNSIKGEYFSICAVSFSYTPVSNYAWLR